MSTTTADLTHDECRRILRRLELETYSNVISTFRAQGSLSELKIKILEDLRSVFHITIDRHRAEARRAANDDQLCMVADKICGNNATSEWNCQGRRLSPVLPRICAITQSGVDMTSEQIAIENPFLEKFKIGPDVKVKSSALCAEEITKLVEEKKEKSVASLSSRKTPIRSKIQEIYITHSTLGQKQRKLQCGEQTSKYTSLVPLTCHTNTGKASHRDYFPNGICDAKEIGKKRALVAPKMTSKESLADSLSKLKVFSRIPALGKQQRVSSFNFGKQLKNTKITEEQENKKSSAGLMMSNSFHLPEKVTFEGTLEIKLRDMEPKAEAFEASSVPMQNITAQETDSFKDLSLDSAVTMNPTELNKFNGEFSSVIQPDLEVIYASEDTKGVFLETKRNETLSKPISDERKLDFCSQNIVCSSGNAKFPQTVMLRKIPNRKKWKICASPCGKFFIQSNRANQLSGKFKTFVTTKNFVPTLTLEPSSLQSARIKTSRILDKSNLNKMRNGNGVIGHTIAGNCMALTSSTDFSSSKFVRDSNLGVVDAITVEKVRRKNVFNGCCHGNKMVNIDASVDVTTASTDNHLNMSTEIKVSKQMTNSGDDGKQLTLTKKLLSKNDCRMKSLMCLTKENTIQDSFAESTYDEKEIKNYATNNVDWEVELDQEASKKEQINYSKVVHQLQNSSQISNVTGFQKNTIY